ncbi:hypothetical protein AVEN_82869-1 [Araneus ventricosus]|uniref:Uncharacterized protein n=1 Tax=Araneus ventricosus TaxID=182803 RepID=A0A4Y2AKL1_ARAVE|nr:hypothetical protein AVEN_82869-1 [Araneus ventricosus]
MALKIPGGSKFFNHWVLILNADINHMVKQCRGLYFKWYRFLLYSKSSITRKRINRKVDHPENHRHGHEILNNVTGIVQSDTTPAEEDVLTYTPTGAEFKSHFCANILRSSS